MTVLEKIRDLGSNLADSVKVFLGPKRVQEATLDAPAGASNDPGHGFRSITARSDRDLTPLSQDRMIQIAYFLWEVNGMARRIVELTRDFVVGEGITFEAKTPEVEAVLKKFWDDPVNLFDLKLPKKVAELGLYGEQCYPAFTSEFAGNVRLGYVDPADIKEVITDPENCESVIGVCLKSRGNKKGKQYKAILAGEAEEILSGPALAIRDKLTDGECFFFTINNVSNATRGRSDLLSVADWVDAYEQFLFDRVDMRALINAFVWDITFEGMNQEQIKEALKDMPAPQRGMVFGHNERITRQAIAPDLKADDASTDATTFKNHILGSKGMPPTWFAEGGDVNRASAAEMEPPTTKMLTARQKVVKYIVQLILRYQIQKKVDAGELAELVETEDGEQLKAVDAFTVIAPDISVKDTAKLSTALQQLSTALIIAEQQGWVTKEAAAKVFAMIASGLGMEVEPADPDQEPTEPEATRVTEDYTDPERVRRSFAA